MRDFVNRAEFGAAIIAATAAPHTRFKPSDLVAEFAIKRDSSDLLAPFTVQISLRNATKTIVRVDFATTDLYRIDVRRDDLTVWSNAFGHTPLAIARRIDVPPGLFRLVSEIVDGTTDDRRAYAPGRYVVRVTMLGTTLKTTSD